MNPARRAPKSWQIRRNLAKVVAEMSRLNKLTQLEGLRKVAEFGEFGESGKNGDSGEISPKLWRELRA